MYIDPTSREFIIYQGRAFQQVTACFITVLGRSCGMRWLHGRIAWEKEEARANHLVWDESDFSGKKGRPGVSGSHL
jgi:hypothetical protein